MNIIESSVSVLDAINGVEVLKKLESAGRLCYKSEQNITEDSYKTFIKNIIARGHLSVLEHESITFKFVCDRAVSHELVRHRIASYSQESQRYCNYSKNGIEFIRPSTFPLWDDFRQVVWEMHMAQSERTYNKMIEAGCKPEEARSVLPNSTKTEIICTMNLRELRHVFALRTSIYAHPDIRKLFTELLSILKKAVPIVFDDIEVK
jgi:thymidylate synthase (FAD)